MKQLKAEDETRIAEAAKLGACPKCGAMLGHGHDARPHAMKIKPPDGAQGMWFNCGHCGNKFNFDGDAK